WSIADGQPLGEPIEGHAGSVLALAAAKLADRYVIVSGSSDGTICRWNLSDGRSLSRIVRAHLGRVWALSVAEVDGHRILVSGGSDGHIRYWNLAVGHAALTGTGAPPAAAFNDSVTVLDHLNHGVLADAIARFIRNTPTATSLSVAIKGDWGAGKSSLMA